jgi:hypothetical protein
VPDDWLLVGRLAGVKRMRREGGDQPIPEDLRVALQRYRIFFQRLLST